ncbi:IS630 family transposase [Reticulibacter mediterranei]|uniref:IS630 family transposase n=1 Tax=Reticulibacter mediterranei TaxID=2778369 RepID=UPI001F2D5C47|nr:IS630 family transposase [Reticulibacter mediterranei]
MRAYSYDLRQRLLRAVDQGMPRAEISQTFAVSYSTIKRYLKLRRETDDVKPKAIPGRPSKKGAALHAGLLPQLEAHPNATLDEHCQFWEATHGIPVSSATMSRAITRLNWTRKKKTIQASEQNEADRAAWREQAKTLDASKLVFIDECGSNIALTRVYARSLKGKRVYGSVPRNRRANTTLLASLSLQGMSEAFLLEGSADSAVFELYIEQILAPSLPAGHIVILDNLNTHTGEKGRQAIEARRCQLLFLPRTLPTCHRSKRRFCAGWERALQRGCKKLLGRHSSRLLPRMPLGGLSIVAIARLPHPLRMRKASDSHDNRCLLEKETR